jgi:FkbM family methyltransferase
MNLTVMNHTSPFSKRFSLVEVGTLCLLVAALAGMAGRWLGPSPQSHQRELPEAAAEIGTAQHLGEKGAAVWMQLQQRYGTRNSRNAEEWVVRDFFQDKRGGVFLDVGAADAREWNNTYFLETTLGWSGLAIDAEPAFAPQYARLRPRTRFFSLFVSDVSDADETFYVPTNGPLGATSNSDFARRDEGPVEVRSVRTITLNDLLAREGTARLDFLSMDIELSEPRALAGFDIERYRPALVCIEAHPEVRQHLIDYFHRHHYIVVGKYLGVDAQNLYFMPF